MKACGAPHSTERAAKPLAHESGMDRGPPNASEPAAPHPTNPKDPHGRS